MNIKGFTEAQRLALLDLVVLGMYADGHLASVEDARAQRLLVAMGFESEFDRSKQFDASLTRVRPHSETASASAEHAATLAQSFISREHRQQVLNVIDDLLSSDGKVSAQESAFLKVIKERF